MPGLLKCRCRPLLADRHISKPGADAIPTNDLWIAASALQHGLILATRDEHYAAIEGLATVDTASGFLP